MENKKRRKRREKEQTKKRILDCAELIISQKGVAGTTMDEVAQMADVSKGSLYLFFQNKHEMASMICLKGITKLEKEFSTVLLNCETGNKMVAGFWKITRCFMEEYPHYNEIFLYLERSGFESNYAPNEYKHDVFEQFENVLSRLFAYLHRALQVGIQDGSIRSSIDSEILAVIIWAELQGLIQIQVRMRHIHRDSILKRAGVEPEESFEKFLQLVTQG